MEIRIHTNKKHRAIGYYFSIIRGLINSSKNPFNKLYYVDLYCGDGTCSIKSTGRKYNPPIIDSILKPAKEGKFNLSCFLNDFNPEIISLMEENTKDYKDFVKDYGCEDANTYYKKVLKFIPKDQFSIFFLDPTNHNDLKWNTIKEISNHTHAYKIRNEIQTRRPELIINFMIHSLINAYRAGSYDCINLSLGTTKWMDKINQYQKMGVSSPVVKGFLDVFVTQLKGLGYWVPKTIKITNTAKDSIVYYLVWATNKRGYDIIENKLIPKITNLMEVAQKENKINLKIAKAKKEGVSLLRF